MKALLHDLESSAHSCALDASVLNARNRLNELASTVLNSPDPKEFTSLRDELTELMLELPAEQRLTPSQIFHVYESTVARLNMPFISFQAKHLLTLSRSAPSTTSPTARPSHRCSLSSISKTNSERTPTKRRTKQPRPPPSPPPAAPQQMVTPAASHAQCATSAARKGTRRTRVSKTPTLRANAPKR